MTEIWIHRKCAREGDELVLPKTYKDCACEFCGKTVDKVFLHEGESFNESAPIKDLIDGETEVGGVDAEKWDKAESIPEIEGMNPEGNDLSQNITIEDTSSEEPSEEVVYGIEGEAEPEPSVTLEVKVDTEKAQATLSKLESQIADLKAKKEALEK